MKIGVMQLSRLPTRLVAMDVRVDEEAEALRCESVVRSKRVTLKTLPKQQSRVAQLLKSLATSIYKTIVLAYSPCYNTAHHGDMDITPAVKIASCSQLAT